jgi:tetratricopeptide (TPR) repeat protein
MKNLFFLLFMVSFSVFSFGQELSAGLQAKNDGNEAYRNKEYVKAIISWEIYLNSGEEGVSEDINTKSLYQGSFKYAANQFMQDKDYQSAFDYFKKYIESDDQEAKTDGKTMQYMGYCASKIDKNSDALSCYQKSIELNYNIDANMLYIASIYKGIGDEEKMKATILEALEKYPDSKSKPKLVAMLVIPLMKVAAEPFKAANELAKKASTGAPENYVANMTPAIAKFEESIPLLEDVLKYDPQNENAKNYLGICNTNIKAFNDYKESLIKK